jgi:hypothetical protein
LLLLHELPSKQHNIAIADKRQKIGDHEEDEEGIEESDGGDWF